MTSITDELAALRSAVRRAVADLGGTTTARALLDGTSSGDAWDVVGTQIGLAALGLPEALGGAGGGLHELAIVAEELGRALVPAPLVWSTALCGQVLAAAGDADGVMRIAAGEVIAFAGLLDDGTWNPDAVSMVRHEGTVVGRNDLVCWGARATAYVVPCLDGSALQVAIVERDAPGVEATPLATLDPSTDVTRVQFSSPPARLLEVDVAAIDRAVDLATVVQAAGLLGVAQACLDLTTQHLRDRHQFGRALGSFQAPKHRAADLLVAVEMARSAVDRALRLPDDDGRGLAEAASVAASWTSDMVPMVATETVHLHGGVGFTWEHDAHLYLRRARSEAALLGDQVHHRERLAGLLGW